MNILMIGDVVAEHGCDFLLKNLPKIKRFYNIDMCTVNGENSANGNGITENSAQMIFAAGADVITTGNHVYKQSNVYDYLDREPFIIRPANYPQSNPGKGYCIVDKGAYRIAVVNISGVVFMENLENPFFCIDRVLKEIEKERAAVTVIDFHAETTSEKKAMGFYLDGRASVLSGTHTHVQTSDASVLPGGLGYITDLGMTGNTDSVLGVSKDIIIAKFKNFLPSRFDTPNGKCMMEGCVFNVDEKTGKCLTAESLRIS